ncbi:MAG: 3-carboxy-cis,cis-muconate cycloisomerase [Chloroflexota bacterium]|nr:3-carboxy-cis,cis-muconate cycloisomerase [Chloroflexota bacterium]
MPEGLFDGVLARGPVREAVADAAWLQAMVDVEVALARSLARAGLGGAEEVAAIERACAQPFDVAALGREAAATGNPVLPLVRAIEARLGEPTGSLLHRGATSQDVLDTAAMLVSRRALDLIAADLDAAAAAAADLARAHRDTPMAGRTFLQQAVPTSFGLKAAGWMSGLDAALSRLREIADRRLAVQLGGAAGTRATFGDADPEVARLLAAELGLAEAPLPWHTERSRIGELAGGLGVAAAALGKPALDIVLLAQTEVAEVREGVAGRGASSAMPHKRNPVAAVAVLAAARAAPGLVATLLATGVQAHERAAGEWQAEWRPLTELLRTVGSGAAWLRDCLEHLEIDRERMLQNVDRHGGLLFAEAVASALLPSMGRQGQAAAERVVDEARASGRPFGEVLTGDPEIGSHLTPEEIARLLDPRVAVRSAAALVDRALALRANRTGQ